MYEKTLAIVLRSSNYRDYDRMLTLFSREHGRIDTLARGCRKQGSELLPVAEVFACSDFEMFKRGDRYFIAQGELKQSFFELRGNIKALMTAMTIAEVTEKIIQPDSPNARLFALVINALYALSKGMDAKPAFIFFVFKLLDILGLRPVTDRCVVCGGKKTAGADMMLGGAVCAEHLGDNKAFDVTVIDDILARPSKSIGGFVCPDSAVFDIACDWLVNTLEQEPKSLVLMKTALK